MISKLKNPRVRPSWPAVKWATKDFSVDIFARAQSPVDYSVIGEVKSRDLRKFSKDEAVQFLGKFEEIKKVEKLEKSNCQITWTG